jgi:hypothetical protein
MANEREVLVYISCECLLEKSIEGEQKLYNISNFIERKRNLVNREKNNFVEGGIKNIKSASKRENRDKKRKGRVILR